MVASKEKQKTLNKLGKVLNLAGIFLAGSEIKLSPTISIGESIEGQRQTFKDLTFIAFDQKENPDDEDFKYRYRICYKFGIRYVNKDLEEDDENFVLIEIKADFESHYLSDEELREEEIEVFSELNVPYNIWPYWREYIQSTCSRMGLPPIAVPFQTNMQDV